MKKGVIVTNAYYNTSAPTFQAERIKEELQRLKSEVYIYKNNAYDSYIGNNGASVSGMRALDYAVFLDKDKYLSRLLDIVGVKMFNSTKAIEVCDDKMLTHLALADSGIKMPVTIPAPLCYNPSAEITEVEADKVIKILGLPLVVKSSFGSLGREVYLARSKAELLKLMRALKCRPYLFQQYIPSSFGKDVRIIVIGGKTFSSMLRKSDADFRSNVDLGGTGYPFNPSDDFAEAAEKAAAVLGLDYCGVDLLFGDGGEPILCEVNSNAFFKEMERVTGKNVGKAYAEYVMRVLNG